MSDGLVEFFRNAATRFSDREAVVEGDRRVHYRELWSDACAVAAFLGAAGAEKGARIALLIRNSPEYIAAYYGIIAAGCVAVPLNTSTKSRDLVNWLRHSEASWLFADARHPELPDVIEKRAVGLKVALVGESKTPLSNANATPWKEVVAHRESGNSAVFEARDPHALAAIVYTSGTTGDPKGVMLSHKNLAANTRSIIEYLRLTEQDRIVNVLPFYYSYGNSVLHTHLAVGACVVLENTLTFPQKVVERIVKERATGFAGVPSTYAILMNRTKLSDYDLCSLRYMTQAGGPMPPVKVRELIGTLPHVAFFIMYGQTEATARLTYLPHEKLEKKLGSVGIPIPGVEIDIRDQTGQPTEVGATGEIWAKGDNVMLGYWRNPEQTQKVLNDGWLKTGDLAHFDADRYIYIDGRSSDIIKVGGYRVSPKEIEEVISEVEGVAEVGVVGIADELLGQVIKAVVVAKPGVRLEIRRIQQYCLKNLAQYKIPKTIELRDSLPRTASGKIQRHLL
jgi:acyl-CoA synthetase (AMP-forming)/AMP-acid ligase II